MEEIEILKKIKQFRHINSANSVFPISPEELQEHYDNFVIFVIKELKDKILEKNHKVISEIIKTSSYLSEMFGIIGFRPNNDNLQFLFTKDEKFDTLENWLKKECNTET